MIKYFPNISVTKKSEGIRMGKGKGNIKFWFNSVSKGTIIAEMNGCSWGQAKKITRLVKDKLSVKVFLFLKKARTQKKLKKNTHILDGSFNFYYYPNNSFFYRSFRNYSK